MTVLSVLCLSSITTGCGLLTEERVVTQVVYQRQELPAQLLHCADLPAPPSARPLTESLIALDIEAIKGAWADCRGKVDGIRELVTVGVP